MYLKSVEILNYRLFYGNNHFDFSSYEDKAINIIFGRNGSGKSSLIDAIYWCLYGIEMREIGCEPIYNDIIAEETPNGDEFNVKVTLSLIDNQNHEILIKRSICFHKQKDIISKSKKFNIYLDEFPVLQEDLFIRKCCSKELFDLMYINDINVLSNYEFYNKIKSILYHYFQLNIISNASNHLKKSYSRIFNEYNDGYNTQLNIRYEELVNNHKEICNEIEGISQLIHEKKQLLKEYQNNSVSKELFLQKEVLLKEFDELCNHLEKEKFNYYYLVLSSYPITVLFNDLRSDVEKFKTFENYPENESFKTYFAEDIFKLKHDLKNIKDINVTISKLVKHISRIEAKIDYIHSKIGSIDELLRGVDEPNIYEINSLQNELDKLLRSRGALEYREKFTKKEISDFKKRMKITKSKSLEFHKKEEFYRNALSNINKIHDILFKSILNEISNSMNTIFIRNFGMSNKYSHINMGTNLEFEIVKNSGKSIKFFDLSLSEQYILYLSVALSIQHIIDEDIFLIIDTQFLNFDKEHWLNFLSLLQNNNQQCILLFNEFKYETDVKSKLMENIANEYELINSNDKIKVVKYGN